MYEQFPVFMSVSMNYLKIYHKISKVRTYEKLNFGGGWDGGRISASRAKRLGMGTFFSWADLSHSEGGLSPLGWLLGG